MSRELVVMYRGNLNGLNLYGPVCLLRVFPFVMISWEIFVSAVNCVCFPSDDSRGVCNGVIPDGVLSSGFIIPDIFRV